MQHNVTQIKVTLGNKSGFFLWEGHYLFPFFFLISESATYKTFLGGGGGWFLELE